MTKRNMKIIGQKRFSVIDTLNFRFGLNNKTLREELVERASFEIKIPDEAIDIWTAEITIEPESCTPYGSEFVITFYYDPIRVEDK